MSAQHVDCESDSETKTEEIQPVLDNCAPPPALFDDDDDMEEPSSANPNSQSKNEANSDDFGDDDGSNEGRSSDDGFDVVDDIASSVPLYITTNENGSRLAIGHQQGFTVYQNNSEKAEDINNSSTTRSKEERKTPHSSGGGGGGRRPSEPFPELFRHHSKNALSGVGIVSLLFETQYIGVVGGGSSPMAAEHKLLLYSGVHSCSSSSSSQYNNPNPNAVDSDYDDDDDDDLSVVQDSAASRRGGGNRNNTKLLKTIIVSDPIKRVVLAMNICIILTQCQFVVTNFKGERLMEQPANGGLHIYSNASLVPQQPDSVVGGGLLTNTGTFVEPKPVGAATGDDTVQNFQRRPPLAVALSVSIVAYPDVAQGRIRLAHFSALAQALPPNSSGPPPAILVVRTDGTKQKNAAIQGSAEEGCSAAGGLESSSGGGGGGSGRSTPPGSSAPSVQGGAASSILESTGNSLGASIDAHDNPLACIAMSVDGTVVASASSKGTLIRVWKVEDGSKVAEVRNAIVPQPIYQLGLSAGNHIFCLTGRKLKIFHIGHEATEDELKYSYLLAKEDRVAQNGKSYFSSLAWMNKYFDSRWACSDVDLPATAFPLLHKARALDGTGTASLTAAVGVTATSTATTTNAVVSNASSLFSSAWSYATGATAEEVRSTKNPSSATTTTVCPTSTFSSSGSTQQRPLCVEDSMVVWWSTSTAAKATSGAASSPLPLQSSTGRFHLTVAASESMFMQFDFDAVLGAVHPAL